MQVAWYLGESSRSLAFLSWVEGRNSRGENRYSLPLWVPDWSVSLPDNIRLLAPGNHSSAEMWSTLYRATGNEELVGRFNLHEGTLEAEGLDIDTVKDISGLCTSIDEALSEEWREFLRAIAIRDPQRSGGSFSAINGRMIQKWTSGGFHTMKRKKLHRNKNCAPTQLFQHVLGVGLSSRAP